MVGIDQDMADFAVRTHSFDAVRIISRRHCPILPLPRSAVAAPCPNAARRHCLLFMQQFQ
jgi:hypothetical protein